MLKNKQKSLFHKKPRCFSKSELPWAELWGGSVYLNVRFKNGFSGMSLAVHWVQDPMDSIPTQGTKIPMSQGNKAQMLQLEKPVHHNYWTCRQQWRPSRPKNWTFFFLRTVSRVTIALWVSWSQALLTFLLNVLWTSLFGSGLNSRGARCGVQAVSSSSRGSGFWVMLTVVCCSELWFMTRLCLSLSYPLQCGLFLFAQRVRIDQLVLLSPKTTPQEIIFYVALNSLYPWENVSSVCYFFEPEHPRIFLF